MKVLLLSVVLGLLYAGHSKAQLLLIPFSGEWKTHYIAASNKDKITENGPFHIYVRHIQFHVNNTADVDFYVKSDGECVKKQVTGEKQADIVYYVDCKYLMLNIRVFHWEECVWVEILVLTSFSYPIHLQSTPTNN
ncbi:male-specific submandibular salivary gland protein-like [Oryx dammah]|uniref:male-specific submandibular salivary gland protein-like n=1 Tax=Oryx dammah TaxID=59534 RepID=UPI001A9C0721|nr:male-specific submandibular salivary gland protein-like [Oryx dammah]